MRALLLSLSLALPLVARPTLLEALLADPENGLAQEILPTPDDLLTIEESGFEFDVSDYGDSIALHGDFAFVSAPIESEYGNLAPGAVYVFHRGPSGWTVVQKLLPPDASQHHRFGESLDIREDGSVLVVGSNDEFTSSTGNNGVASGAYVYRFTPVNRRFAFEQKLVPADHVRGDRSGSGVAISGDWIGVGSPGEDGSFSDDVGDVTIFAWDPAATRWVERDTLGTGDYDFTPVGDPGTFDLDGDLFASFNDFSDGADARIFRRAAATGYWTLEGGAGSSSNFAQPITSFGPVGILTHGPGRPFLSRRPAAPGGSWTPIDTSTFTGSRSLLSAAMNSSLVAANFGGGETPNPDPVLEFHRIGETSTTPLGSADTARRGRATAIEMDEHTVLFAEFKNSFNVSPDIQVSAFVADPARLIAKSRSLMFYQDAPPADREDAAFAYQVLLFDDAPGGFITRHDEIGTLYGPANRAHADRAEEILRLAYPTATGATAAAAENLFLDLAYGRAAARLILSKDAVAALDAERLEVRANLFLDTEIAALQGALAESAAGIDHYLMLLQDPLGRPPVGGNPAGRALFARHVPDRALFPATDADGDVVAVDGAGIPLDPAVPVLPGFKDLVLLHDLFLHHTRTAARIAYLLTARDTPADRAAARSLIGDTQRLVFEQRPLLSALFAPAALPPALRESLGLAELDRGIDAALNELAAFEQNLEGTINLLGYEPDFLMLIQNQGGLFDSFDSFKSILNQPNSPLNVAKNNRAAALTAIANYGANQDDLESEFSLIATSSTSALIPRLTEIVGVPFGTPGYESPQDNVGSEIWQQIQSIEVARTRILRNSAEISNLRQKVAIENQRRAKEAGINSELADLIIDYGNQQASMTEEIGRIEATQKAADALTDLFEIENITKVITGLGVINAAVQAGGEIGKANLEASKERLAASQEAAIRRADDDILDNNSKALVKTLLLEMNTLLIDSQEAAILLRQEAGRLTSLVGEKADLERRLDEVDAQLAARYFADPVHRLRALNTTELATLSFRNARKWLFFSARALEYKWNTPFNLPAGSSSDGRAWKTTDLFKLRNAHELDRFFIALVDWDTLVGNNRTFVPYEDWFSLREDYFGYDRNDDLTGAPLFYDVVNPATGQIENVDAVTAFRHSLRRLLDDVDNDGQDEIALRFDTLRQNEFDTVANDYLADLFSPENYLDRLETIRVFVRGPHQNLSANDGDNTIPAELSYLGTSVIRNESPGAILAPNRPDRVSGEFTSYPNRFYRFFASGYRFEEGLTFNTAEALKVLPGRSRSLLEAPGEPAAIQAFRERSVATSSWLLVLSPNAGVNPGARLVIDEIDDIELFILHRAVQR
jgi:hypothetical protein